MTEAGPGCNPRSEADGVLHDVDAARPVDKRHVEAHLGVLARRFAADEFRGGGTQPRHLPGREMFGGGSEGRSAFHLDEHDPVAVACDEVDLPAAPAPAPRGDFETVAPIVRLDLFLGNPASVMGDGPPQSSPASFSAIW